MPADDSQDPRPEIGQEVDALLRSVVDGMVIIDEGGLIERVNPAAERMFGYHQSELLGRNVKLLMPPPYAEEHDGYIANYLRTGTGKIIGIGREVVGLRRDGSRFPLRLGVSVLPGRGSLRFTGILRDLTQEKTAQEELRRNQERFELVTRATRDVIWDCDLVAGTLWCSDRHGEIYGEAPADWSSGRAWWLERVHPEDRPDTEKAFGEALAGRAERCVLDYRYRRRDGAYDFVLDHFHIVRDAEGRAVRLVGARSDVSERMRLQDELLQAQKMEAVGRLAGGIAHDFNNLLMGVLSACRLVEDRLDSDSPARPVIADIKAELESASGLTRQLLDFSRRRAFRIAPLDLGAAVASAEKMLRHLVGEDVELSVDAPADLRAVVRADAGKLSQILMNLAVNARDAMPRGGRLSIALSTEGDEAVLAVRDTGTGMDEETRKHAFEPFFTTKQPGQGTGLGLSTVFGLVAEFGGRIDLESEVDRGTTFRLRFPLCGEEPAAAEAPERQAGVRGSGQTVLVVEDERLVRQGLRMLLSGLGYEVVVADRPARALEILAERERAVALILTDIVMPGMDGPELARRVRAEYPEVRVVFMSAYSAEALAEQGRIPAGAHVLEKPFDGEQLAAALVAALGQPPA